MMKTISFRFNDFKPILLLTVTLALVLLFNITTAYACSCAPPGTPQESLQDSTAVFSGQVIRIDTPAAVGGIISTADPLKVTFQVIEIWKGPLGNPLIVQTARDSVSCGYNFLIGQEYLVYAYGSESDLQTNICTRTTPLTNAAGDLQAIGSGSVPPPFENGSSPSSINWLLVISILFLVLALAAFMIVLLYRPRGTHSSA